jgi:hypothetical protein
MCVGKKTNTVKVSQNSERHGLPPTGRALCRLTLKLIYEKKYKTYSNAD